MTLDDIKDFHIHVYFDKKTFELAQSISQQAAKEFSLELGRFHQKNVGPHPRWSVQLRVPNEKLSDSISWFSLNRSGLTLFIHPNTGDDLKDHRDHAIWMGDCLELNLSMFETI